MGDAYRMPRFRALAEDPASFDGSSVCFTSVREPDVASDSNRKFDLPRLIASHVSGEVDIARSADPLARPRRSEQGKLSSVPAA